MTLRKVAVAAAVLAFALSIAVVGYQYQSNRTTEKLRADALTSATQYAEGLATYDFDDPTANLDRVTAASTEEFAGTYRDVSTRLQELLVAGQGRATGTVTAAGLVELDDERAVVAVFLDQDVRNLSVPDGRVDSSRMLIGLSRVDNRWLLSSADPR